MGGGFSHFMGDVWNDTIGALIKGVKSLFETGGGSAIYGPAAKKLPPFDPNAPKPPSIPKPGGGPRANAAQLLPGQQGIHNSLNTSQQYMARFGSQQHF
jgi:hypothetical protein